LRKVDRSAAKGSSCVWRGKKESEEEIRRACFRAKALFFQIKKGLRRHPFRLSPSAGRGVKSCRKKKKKLSQKKNLQRDCGGCGGGGAAFVLQIQLLKGGSWGRGICALDNTLLREIRTLVLRRIKGENILRFVKKEKNPEGKGGTANLAVYSTEVGSF